MTSRRTRAGCEACKRRHVKCDEGKPICGHCKRRGDECVYNPPKTWVFDPQKPLRPLAAAGRQGSEAGPSESSQSDSRDASEVRTFSFHAGNIARALAPVLGGSTYSALPEQTPNTETALAYFVEAFSLVNDTFQAFEAPKPDDAVYLRAMSKAMRLLCTAEMVDVDVRMTMCNALMGAAEAVRTEDPFVLAECDKGFATLRQWQAHRDAPLSVEDVEAYSTTIEYMMSIQANCKTSHDARVILGHAGGQENPADEDFLDCLGAFETLSQAALSLHNILVFHLLSLVRVSQSTWIVGASIDTIHILLAAWQHSFKRLELQDQPDLSSDNIRIGKCLAMHHIASCIVSTCLPQADENAFLLEDSRFESIVDDLEYLIQHDWDQARYRGIYAPLNLISPAFLAATKCRNPVLRHRALEVLRVLNVVEGAWNSTTAYHIAEMIVSIEEKTRQCTQAGQEIRGSVNLIRAESARFTINWAEERATITLRYQNFSTPGMQEVVTHYSVQDEDTMKSFCSTLWPLDPTLRSWGYLQSNLIPDQYRRPSTSSTSFSSPPVTIPDSMGMLDFH